MHARLLPINHHRSWSDHLDSLIVVFVVAAGWLLDVPPIC